MEKKDLNIIHKDKIKDQVFERWLETYDTNSLVKELESASIWLQDNEKKYKSYCRFYGNWLRRSAKRVTVYNTTTVNALFKTTGEGWPSLLSLIKTKDTSD